LKLTPAIRRHHRSRSCLRKEADRRACSAD
jgi:hypothetical protein